MIAYETLAVTIIKSDPNFFFRYAKKNFRSQSYYWECDGISCISEINCMDQ